MKDRPPKHQSYIRAYDDSIATERKINYKGLRMRNWPLPVIVEVQRTSRCVVTT